MTKTEIEVLTLMSNGYRLFNGLYTKNLWLLRPGQTGVGRNTKPFKVVRRAVIEKLRAEKHIVVGVFEGEMRTSYMLSESLTHNK